nr:MAG TPA: hypothetical protein [Caudoviricetes sp.]
MKCWWCCLSLASYSCCLCQILLSKRMQSMIRGKQLSSRW